MKYKCKNWIALYGAENTQQLWNVHRDICPCAHLFCSKCPYINCDLFAFMKCCLLSSFAHNSSIWACLVHFSLLREKVLHFLLICLVIPSRPFFFRQHILHYAKKKKDTQINNYSLSTCYYQDVHFAVAFDNDFCVSNH